MWSASTPNLWSFDRLTGPVFTSFSSAISENTKRLNLYPKLTEIFWLSQNIQRVRNFSFDCADRRNVKANSFLSICGIQCISYHGMKPIRTFFEIKCVNKYNWTQHGMCRVHNCKYNWTQHGICPAPQLQPNYDECVTIESVER